MMITTRHKQQLLEAAISVRKLAYCPYSKYQVGATLLTSDDTIVTGANVENASFGLTIRAERVSVFNAVAARHQNLIAIAVVTIDANAPCGSCRQVLTEFNPEMIVLIGNDKGDLIKECPASTLLPHNFVLKK